MKLPKKEPTKKEIIEKRKNKLRKSLTEFGRAFGIYLKNLPEDKLNDAISKLH